MFGQILQGALAPTATERQRIRLMQRKANLGMNSVLPVSIVLMRVIAAREGLEPEEYMRAVLEAVRPVSGLFQALAREDQDGVLAAKQVIFDNEADMNAHNDSPELEVSLEDLKKLLDGGADYHECMQIASLGM